MRKGLADLHKGSFDEGRRRHKTKGTERLRLSEGRTVPQDAKWGFAQMCGMVEAHGKLKDVHDKTCGSCGEVSLYRKLQRADFYWPSMGKKADQVQTQCGTCQLAADREESYVVFNSED